MVFSKVLKGPLSCKTETINLTFEGQGPETLGHCFTETGPLRRQTLFSQDESYPRPRTILSTRDFIDEGGVPRERRRGEWGRGQDIYENKIKLE